MKTIRIVAAAALIVASALASHAVLAKPGITVPTSCVTISGPVGAR